MGTHTCHLPTRHLHVVDVRTGKSQLESIVTKEGGIRTYENAGNPGSWVVDAQQQWFEVRVSYCGQVLSARAGSGETVMQRLIDQLEARSSRLEACYTCQYYHRTRLANEWSSGTLAYCVLTGETDPENVVHMLHVCADWTKSGE
jgi:hypothetical protein